MNEYLGGFYSIWKPLPIAGSGRWIAGGGGLFHPFVFDAVCSEMHSEPASEQEERGTDSAAGWAIPHPCRKFQGPRALFRPHPYVYRIVRPVWEPTYKVAILFTCNWAPHHTLVPFQLFYSLLLHECMLSHVRLLAPSDSEPTRQ